MGIVQRGFAVILSVAVFMLFVTELYREQENLWKQRWESMQSSCFLYEICRDGYCTYEEYCVYRNSLNILDGRTEVRIREYQWEHSVSGETYRYLITWEEIRNSILEQGGYSFRKGSMAELYVINEEKRGGYSQRYIHMVSGEGQ